MTNIYETTTNSEGCRHNMTTGNQEDNGQLSGGYGAFIVSDDSPKDGWTQGVGDSNTSTRPIGSTGVQEGLSTQGGSFFTPPVDVSNIFGIKEGEAVPKNNKVKERQYTGGDTLDEPVWKTVKRELLQIGRRLMTVIWPAQLANLAMKQQQRFISFAQQNGVSIPLSILRSVHQVELNDQNQDVESYISNDAVIGRNTIDWDLWGPLLFSLLYAVTLGFSARKDQINVVFSGSFCIIWLFFVVVGLNIQLLGGNISFMSAISATGYSMFPIVSGGSLCALLIKFVAIRLIIMPAMCAWSIYSANMSLKCSGVLPGRVFLAIYPVTLLYILLSWLCIIT